MIYRWVNLKAVKRLVEADALKMEIIPNPKVQIGHFQEIGDSPSFTFVFSLIGVLYCGLVTGIFDIKLEIADKICGF